MERTFVDHHGILGLGNGLPAISLTINRQDAERVSLAVEGAARALCRCPPATNGETPTIGLPKQRYAELLWWLNRNQPGATHVVPELQYMGITVYPL